MKAEVDKPIRSLINNLPQVGTLEWIGIRPVRKLPLEVQISVNQTLAVSGD